MLKWLSGLIKSKPLQTLKERATQRQEARLSCMKRRWDDLALAPSDFGPDLGREKGLGLRVFRDPKP